MIDILIHKTNVEHIKQVSKYIEERLAARHSDKMKVFHGGQLIIVDCRIYLEFRCGSDFGRFGGIRPDYYYTDDEGDVRMMLEMGADKVNGLQITDLDDVVKIVNMHMDSYSEIKEYLKAKGCERSYDRN